jgi:homoaconitase/3-isopropylmalate dehydratase large subunit
MVVAYAAEHQGDLIQKLHTSQQQMTICGMAICVKTIYVLTHPRTELHLQRVQMDQRQAACFDDI